MKKIFKYLLTSMLLVGGVSGCKTKESSSSSSFRKPNKR